MFRMMNLRTATLSLCRRSTSSSVNILIPCTRRMWSQMLILQIALSFCIKRFWQALRRNIFTAIMSCPTGLFQDRFFYAGVQNFWCVEKGWFPFRTYSLFTEKADRRDFHHFPPELTSWHLSFKELFCYTRALICAQWLWKNINVFDSVWHSVWITWYGYNSSPLPYCKVVWHCQGTYKNQDGVLNGLRHFHVRIQFAVPSYLRFGKFLLRLYHDGQAPTCRHCNCSGHKAADFHKSVCFNCDGLGHMAREHIRLMYCCICKSGQHLARTCPFSRHREKDMRPGDTPASEHGRYYRRWFQLLWTEKLFEYRSHLTSRFCLVWI